MISGSLSLGSLSLGCAVLGSAVLGSLTLGRLEPGHVWAWIGATLLVVLLGRVVLGPSSPRWVGWIPWAMPPVSLLLSIVCFAGEGHPLAQYSPAEEWELWSGLWPVLLVGCLVGVVLGLVLAARGADSTKRVCAWLFVAVLNVFSFYSVARNFPSA